MFIEGLVIRRSSRVVAVSKFIVSAAISLYPFSALEICKSLLSTTELMWHVLHLFLMNWLFLVGLFLLVTIKPFKDSNFIVCLISLAREEKLQLHIYGKDTLIDW